MFGNCGLVAGRYLGGRYCFWSWICFPWIWFFKDASASYILFWFSFTSFAVYDLDFMRYKVSRGLMCAFLVAVTCMCWIWFLVKGNREVTFSLFCFLAVAVPLDPFFDWVLTHVQGSAIEK